MRAGEVGPKRATVAQPNAAAKWVSPESLPMTSLALAKTCATSQSPASGGNNRALVSRASQCPRGASLGPTTTSTSKPAARSCRPTSR
nr:hypothetical protein [Thermoanaerobaculum aquaticum]